MTDKRNLPVFVVVEGADRVGKDTQVRHLVARLEARGISTVARATPDRSTATGRLLDGVLKGRVLVGEESTPADDVESLVVHSLQVCNRYEVAARVRHDLGSGRSVACSRWWPSTVVYGTLDGLEPRSLAEVCACLPVPDVHVLLDTPTGVPLERLDIRDRYEGSPGRQAQIVESYLRLWTYQQKVDPGRWYVVLADGSPDEVAERVWDVACIVRPELGATPVELKKK